MSHILDFYNDNNGNSLVVKNANEYLINDLLSLNLSGEDKIKDIDGMDMESDLSGQIIPGMIYTFIYKSSKRIEDDADINFGDKFPMLLCTNIKILNKDINGKKSTQLNIQGINLNFLDDKQRLILLEFIVRCYQKFYEDDVFNSVEKNSSIINSDFGNKLSDPNFLKMLLEKTSINLSHCFRSYNIVNCKNIRLIEYNLWKYIPFCSAKRIINNLSIEQIERLQSYINK
jgi:hypothetical protein